jgi:hypothetical protein
MMVSHQNKHKHNHLLFKSQHFTIGAHEAERVYILIIFQHCTRGEAVSRLVSLQHGKLCRFTNYGAASHRASSRVDNRRIKQQWRAARALFCPQSGNDNEEGDTAPIDGS